MELKLQDGIASIGQQIHICGPSRIKCLAPRPYRLVELTITIHHDLGKSPAYEAELAEASSNKASDTLIGIAYAFV